MTQEQANWAWIDARVTKLEQVTEDAFKGLEASIALNKAYQARIKDLETALAFYKGAK